MKKEIYTYTLPKELTIMFIIVPVALLAFSIIFYLKQSYIASVIFFIGTVALAISSTYKKSIYFDKLFNLLSIEKKYLGKTISTSNLKIVPESKLRLFTEDSVGTNTMGYTEISGFLTLALSGKNQDEELQEKVLCSEHRNKEKKLFLEKVKSISEVIGVQIVES
ncbi:MAG: hypothetical protein GQ547_05070 [Methylophaga sp.]|nr:hypothetical protein [Methylophaga sp.]